MGQTTDKNDPPQEELEETEEPKIIDKWDQRQVKNALDEAVKLALSELFPESEENFKLIDTRLWLCFCCVVLSAICWTYDIFYPYPLSHDFMLKCVIPYFIMFLYLSYHMTRVEGDIICVYTNKISTKKTDKWEIATRMGKYDPFYEIELVKNQNKSVEDKFSIGEVIDEDGIVWEENVLDKVKKLVKVCNEQAGVVKGESKKGK